ncbi:phosphoenolpyruvate synthase [Desulfonatronum thiosulfatophilum]|uniref:Phosphoenolpyruvate synthase n=1 Tax=Desulfonatronum thiosulfatophilum TaxID=617002 RepID=A0A1G6CKY5_9BACT|nr:phosphoenolpyruvate synthase [Desulfonatronum thiosulfatophilum]SDB33544.1 phosphoenolpyruvate synthase [Desulfonatronum thiosulfatophilum]
MNESRQDGYIRWFDDLSSNDVALVGGKNASLGEMITSLKEKDIRVPDGFATTTKAYRAFLAENDIEDRIKGLLGEYQQGKASLKDTGRSIRDLFKQGKMPGDVAEAIREAYRELGKRYDATDVDVAARSSATAEDMPEASFAGQQESYLNVTGEDDLLKVCQKCFASLFTNRAISYREEKGFEHMKVALSVGIQKMVRSDLAGSGVLFTLDTDSGFPDVVLINAAWGLGENVVQGTVNPDQYTVFKPFLGKDGIVPIIEKTRGAKEKKMIYAREGDEPTKNVPTSDDEQTSFVLSDEEILQLARWSKVIEDHYGKPMDIEWAKDGEQDAIFIVQARPETVHSRKTGQSMKTYRLKGQGERLVTGLSIGQAIAAGKVCVIESAEQIDDFKDDCILVTTMTDPDWVPIMKRAAAIVTDHGGRTSHAAIVSRELGIAAIVGSNDATKKLRDGQEVTVSCAEGEKAYVYDGILEYEEEDVDLENVPETKTRIMLNIGAPQAAMRWWKLPCKGVGLARMEYLVNNVIKIHPLALTRFDEVEDDKAKARIEELTQGYADKKDYFVELLARGIGTIAASRHPHPVIVRMSDFKTNEYADLIGGRQFEPKEENPMLGWRGASRYYSEDYRDGFALECRAIHMVREKMGFTNVLIMIPFCRTPAEADKVLEVLAENGLKRGERGLEVYVMAEIPTNILEAEAFAERFDGFSIGSNDLTQLVLGISRDSEKLSHLFDESEESVKRLIRMLIETAHKAGRKVGICGEAPSNNSEFAAFLVKSGIDSISLQPDSVLKVIRRTAEVEQGG